MPADTTDVIPVALTRPSRAQRTVLVVDDEPGVRDTLGRLLRQAGYQTRETGSAVDALVVIEHEPVHAIVLDVRMPGRSGLAVLEDIRRARTFDVLPVLMVTGYELEEAEETRIHDLCAYVFHKPAAFAELLRYLDSATGV